MEIPKDNESFPPSSSGACLVTKLEPEAGSRNSLLWDPFSYFAYLVME